MTSSSTAIARVFWSKACDRRAMVPENSGQDMRALEKRPWPLWDCTNVFFGHRDGNPEMRILLHKKRLIGSGTDQSSRVNDSFRYNAGKGRGDLQIRFEAPQRLHACGLAGLFARINYGFRGIRLFFSHDQFIPGDGS